MVKCSKCSKVVSTKNPGVQCSNGKCSKWYHGSCASLTKEQLSTLSTTDSVDWKCRVCTGNAKPKRVSCILQDPEDEESDMDVGCYSATSETEKILIEIRKEVREVIRNELQRTLQFYSEKIDEYDAKVKEYETNMKSVENQCKDLRNICKNLTLTNDTLEQKVNKLEQAQSFNDIEICGIMETEKEDVKQITLSVCQILNQKQEDVIRAYRKKKPSRPGTAQSIRAAATAPIIVSLREGCRDHWLVASKTTNVTTQDLGRQDNTKVYIRESLTPTTAFLLWKTKTELKDKSLCKYVWCKNGLIMVRKEDQDKKVHVVRSVRDIDRIAKDLQNK